MSLSQPDRDRRPVVRKGPIPEDEPPLRPEDPFRAATHQLAITDEARRRALKNGTGQAASMALVPIASDLRSILDKAIGVIRNAETDPESDLVLLRGEASNALVLSTLRSVIITEELALLVEMPASDIESALRDLLYTGELRAESRTEALDALTVLRDAIGEAEKSHDHLLTSILVPYVTQIALLLGVQGAAAALGAAVIGESVGGEIVKALIIFLVVRACLQARRAIRERRRKLSDRSTSRAAHRQLLRDLSKYDFASLDDLHYEVRSDERARWRLQLIVDLALIKKRTMDDTWDGKTEYWGTLDDIQDWVEGRKPLPAVYHSLDRSKPPRSVRWSRVEL